jgi:hypothetical protein
MNAWLVMLSFFGSMASVNSASAQALYSMDLMRTFGADPSDPFKPRELDLWDLATQFSHQGKYGSWKKLFGITVGITVSQFIINMLPLRYMNKAAWVSFGIMVSGCLMIIIGLPAIALKHQTWRVPATAAAARLPRSPILMLRSPQDVGVDAVVQQLQSRRPHNLDGRQELLQRQPHGRLRPQRAEELRLDVLRGPAAEPVSGQLLRPAITHG